MSSRPKLFLGCSSEAKEQAEAFATELRPVADVIPWWEAPHFAPSTGTLEALVAATQEFDFGLFLLTPDDALESRGVEGHTARDNVLFELGLFLGELGRNRTFGLVQRGPGNKTVRVPSDLRGITLPSFSSPRKDDFSASVAAAAAPVARLVDRYGFRQLNFNLIEGWSYDAERGCFRVVLSETLVLKYFYRLHRRKLLMVVRRRDDSRDLDSDDSVTVGDPRPVPRSPQRIVMEAKCEPLLEAHGEPILDAHLYLLPPKSRRRRFSTIADVLAAGGRLVETRGRGISDYLE